MESWCLSKYKSSLLLFLILLIIMNARTQGASIEDERKALLEIKASLHKLPNSFDVDNILSTWVDHGSTGGEWCGWERIQCDTANRHVTDLSLSNIFSIEHEYYSNYEIIWPLNVSLFLHFKELRSLDLSWNYIGNTLVSTGLRRFSSLKKLELLNLSYNYIDTNIVSSLGALTSLKTLDLRYINGQEIYIPPLHDISEFPTMENLEVLDLTGCGYYGTLPMQDSEKVSISRQLKSLNLGDNYFNESVITSLSVFPSLKELDLSSNCPQTLSFPSEELSHLTNLEKLDLSDNYFNTQNIKGCKRLTRLQRLENINLAHNEFNMGIISCLSLLPSLKILDLSYNSKLGRPLPIQELSSLRELKKLNLESCGLESLTLNGTITMSNLLYLNLDHNYQLNDDIIRSLAAFPSLKFLSMNDCYLSGRLFANEIPNLPELEVLILSWNSFNGTLPMEALASFRHLEVLDLGINNFVGSIPLTIKTLSSLKVVSFALNQLNGSLSGLCELKNLYELDLRGNMFDGILPECFNKLSTLKFFDISFNQLSGALPSSLITKLTYLEYVDFSYNKFEGSFSFSSFSNHKKIEFVSFISNNGKFQVETEEPIGWTPMFQLKVLVLSNCNIKMPKGSVVPGFLLHQYKLKKLEMSHNSLKGQFPSWLIKNNTMLEVVNVRNNSFDSISSMSFYRNPSTRWMDMSENHIVGAIPRDLQKSLPYIEFLNLSRNSLDGSIPSSIGDLGELNTLDLSHNELSGEVSTSLFTNLSQLSVLILSNNNLHGEVLSGYLNMNRVRRLHLDSNSFTGSIGNNNIFSELTLLDISNNLFTGVIPDWISNTSTLSELLVRNNSFGGQFPCGGASFVFLDISQNYLSGVISSCLNFHRLEHLHLGYNKFTGPIPSSFRNLSKVLTLDIGNNYFSGRIPKFLGDLSSLRILLLRKNNFSGFIPKELCQLTNASLIDLSSNHLSGSIPSCLQNISGPSNQAFVQSSDAYSRDLSYHYVSVLYRDSPYQRESEIKTQDEVTVTTKTLSLTYKGGALNIMSGLDLSCNKLTGDIPEELGLLNQIHTLNLSHNRLTGPIPAKFSNLANIESLDLSFNSLTGQVPSQLVVLKSLAVFNVSYNNLSGRLPEMKAQFGTFSKESYEGNPLLCGLPLENKCTTESHVNHPSNEEKTDDKWFDKTSFYGSCGSTWFVFMLGFAALLYVNPYWRRRWLYLVEECMYTCYYFLYDLVRKLFMLFHKQE